MRGEFIFFANTPERIVIPNMITDEGEEAFLKMLMQGDATIVAAGGNFYVGLSSDTPVETITLGDLAAEPSSANGYARQAVTRDATGFPTITQVNGVYCVTSALISFTPSGGDFDTDIDRMFLCDAATGTSGTLFAFSGALPAPITVTEAAPFSAQYRLYLD